MFRLTTSLKLAVVSTVLAALSVSGFAAGTSSAAAATGSPAQHTLYWLNSENATATGHASAATRMHIAVNYMRSIHADVAVMVEVEPIQVSYFQHLAGPGWGTVVSQVTRTNPNTTMVVYDKSVWTLAKTASISTVGWGSQRVQTLLPVLKSKATGYVLNVMPVHNPADNATSRSTDIGIERSAAHNTLVTRPGWHFVVAGDFNDSSAIQKMTAPGSHLWSALRTSAAADRSWTPIDQGFYVTNVSIGGYLRTSTDATDHGYQYQAVISE